MNKEQYIKRAFKNYYKNKQRLRELSFDTVRGIDYTKATSKNGTPKDTNKPLFAIWTRNASLKSRLRLSNERLIGTEFKNGRKVAERLNISAIGLLKI